MQQLMASKSKTN